MKQVLVIVGPTAVGKSDLGIELAKKYNGEVISGDSIQVYRGFNIGSGKVTKEEKQGVSHHLIDILDAKDTFSVADFQYRARASIDEIISRGKLPIIVGGTGLYIKACLYDYSFAKQRVEFDTSMYEDFDNEVLYNKLKELDEKASQNIHPNNRKRVLRALAIAASGTNKSEREATQTHEMIYDALILGLTCERERLHERISLRVNRMVDLGLLAEIEKLMKQGVDFEHQAMQGIGYREWREFVVGTATMEEVKEAIKLHSRQFAKRQYTWFKNQMPVTWIDIEAQDTLLQASEDVQQWRNKNE